MNQATLNERTRLTHALRQSLQSRGMPVRHLMVLEHAASRYATSFPIHIVTCQINGERPLKLLCKYDGGQPQPSRDDGHHQGIAYEAAVYEHLLADVQLDVPGFYGFYADPVADEKWLFMEYFEAALGVSKQQNDEPLVAAARWIGRFQAHCETKPERRGCSLMRYDSAYYMDWVQRSRPWATQLRHHWPGVMEAGDRFEPVARWLADCASTVIHGEYYPHNILFHDGRVYPIDWESAALAPGVIDLAAMTENWPAKTIARCVAAYSACRWPDGPPPQFLRMLHAARLYLAFRWLTMFLERDTPVDRLGYYSQCICREAEALDLNQEHDTA